ncbi:GIY-YIG nuclease family protein [Daejeonella sp.]|uniref:GIY-YIG nuclease family protein n=1 Tax=Daejeonella sp. TaxID=2805397 RepID=UPI0030C5207C
MWNYNYYVYITTNPGKTVLYTGVTNDLRNRMDQHQSNKGRQKTFAGKYYCYNLIWYEHFTDIEEAITREKEIKGWRREKKERLTALTNPQWHTLVA